MAHGTGPKFVDEDIRVTANRLSVKPKSGRPIPDGESNLEGQLATMGLFPDYLVVGMYCRP